MRARDVTALALAAGSAAAWVLARWLGAVELAFVTKPLPVLALAFLVFAAPGRRDRSTWLAGAGLLLSALGDAILEPPISHFIGGLVSFLCAHLAYVAAFTAASRSLDLLRAVMPTIYGVSIYLMLSPGVGELAIPVAFYTAVICAMLWRAAVLGASGVPGGKLALLGAVLFVVSDTVLAFNRFRAPVPEASALIMSLYWAGQLGIALSTRQRARSAPTTPTP